MVHAILMTTLALAGAEKAVNDAVSGDLGTPLTSVVCPADVEQAAWVTFTCALTAPDGSTATADVTVTPDAGDFIVDAKLLHTKNGAATIARGIEQQAGTQVRRVDCPDLVPIAKGGTFTCTAIGRDGSRGTVDVRQRDTKENISYNAPLLHIDEAELQIARSIQAQLKKGRPTINCRDIVMVLKGGTFICLGRAKRTGKRFTVDATMTNDRGSFRFKTRLRRSVPP